MTVQFLKPDFTLQKVLFGATEIEGKTEAQIIKASLCDYLSFVELDEANLVSIVRDDAGNVKNAAKLMKKPS